MRRVRPVLLYKAHVPWPALDCGCATFLLRRRPYLSSVSTSLAIIRVRRRKYLSPSAWAGASKMTDLSLRLYKTRSFYIWSLALANCQMAIKKEAGNGILKSSLVFKWLFNHHTNYHNKKSNHMNNETPVCVLRTNPVCVARAEGKRKSRRMSPIYCITSNHPHYRFRCNNKRQNVVSAISFFFLVAAKANACVS